MCRLFANFSQDTIDPSYPLLEAPYSLLRLSKVDRKRKQADGWGLGWIEGGRPRIYKSPNPIFKDLKASLTPTLSLEGRGSRVRDGLTNIQSHTVLGHVRWASNPLKLKKSELIGMAHTQPFQHDYWLFVHNGTLYIPREVRQKLGPGARFIRGKNDSEVLFYWILKTVIHGQGSWPSRVRRSLKELDRIWKSCRKSYPIYKYPYHGLNWVITNGRLLLAFCYVDPRGLTKYPALGHRKQPYYALQIRETAGGIMLASEPLDSSSGWKPVGHGHLIVAEKRRGKISMKNLKVA